MAITDGLKLPIPELTETADGPDAFSDLANALEDYFYDRIFPAGVTPTRRPTYRWEDTAAATQAELPTAAMGAKIGDVIRHTGLNCMLIYQGGLGNPAMPWRQLDVAQVDNATARNAMKAAYAGVLHDGFRLHENTGNREFIWDGVNTWILLKDPNVGTAFTTVGTAPITAATGWSITAVNMRALPDGRASIDVTATRTGAAITVPADGNIANTNMATAGAGWGPQSTENMFNSSVGPITQGDFQNDGTIRITNIAPGSSLATNVQVQLRDIGYLLDNPLALIGG